jgi:hypothetical protein
MITVRALTPGQPRPKQKTLLARFKRIKKTLHPRFFPGRSILFNDPLPCGGIDLLDHIFKRRLSLRGVFLPRLDNKFFRAGSDGAFYRLIPNPALLTLPMTFFSGTALTCQRKTPNNKYISSLDYRNLSTKIQEQLH